jgi:hypothetical protein
VAQNIVECGGMPPLFRREARFARSYRNFGSHTGEARLRESGSVLPYFTQISQPPAFVCSIRCRGVPPCLNGLGVWHFQRLRKLAQFFASRLQSAPFPEDAPALRAKHQVHHCPVRLRSETKIRRHLTRRANENQRSVPSLHSG